MLRLAGGPDAATAGLVQELVARVEGTDRIVLEKRSAGLARLQERFAGTRGRKDLAAALIADRRAEARRDAR